MAELTQRRETPAGQVSWKEERTFATPLAGLLGATAEAVVQWAHLAQEKGLVATERIVANKSIPMKGSGILRPIYSDSASTILLNNARLLSLRTSNSLPTFLTFQFSLIL